MLLDKTSLTVIPFPVFLIESNFTIIQVSEGTQSLFAVTSNFLDVVDIGSRKKAERLMKPIFGKTKLELNLLTKNGLLLFDVHVQWMEEYLLVYCLEKQENLKKIQNMIYTLENQLENENVSLLEKQEKLEATLKKMEELLLEHDNIANFGKMATGIAEELKKPLISIRGFLQLMKPHLIEVGKTHYVNLALDEVDNANNLIYQYLSSTKPSVPEKQQVNIQKELIDVITLLQRDAAKINCDMKYLREQILPVMHLDRKQFHQVVLNIVKNGMEAIQSGPNKGHGQIIIRTKHQNNRLEISITDNGPGMSQETQKRLFTPFFTTKAKGSGIGLAICMKIIQNHGGTIEVSSKEGIGSTFAVILPLEM